LQGGRAVDIGLSLSEQIQIWTVEHQYLGHKITANS